MTWVEALIDKMPELINALAPGFLLFSVFSWATSKHYGSGTTVVIISAVLSYIITQICGCLYDASSVVTTITVYAASSILGFLSALAYKSVWFGKILAQIGVKRTANDSIWDDVVGKRAWIAIYDEKVDRYYCGIFQYQHYESGREYVAIATYYIADSNGNVLEDHTPNKGRKLMVDTSACGKIIISDRDPFNHFEIETTKKWGILKCKKG